MTPRRAADAALVALVSAAFAGYSVVSLANFAAGPPISTWRSLPAAVETFVTEHLAGRDRLLACHAAVRTEMLGASTTPRVWLGDAGWLFYNHHADADYLGSGDPAISDRVDKWAAALSARQAWLADRGIRFLAVAVPD